ncbi:hypothetical protein KORDIASMS9_04642 [Kordia sp. SMS9]|nr:hypothetical protein KORDIASMS9_04642 [Kordia sp. SMS9]
MLKNLLRLPEVTQLKKEEQLRINGGIVCNYECWETVPSPPCICFRWE